MKTFSCVRIDLENRDDLLHRVFTHEQMRDYLTNIQHAYAEREYFPSLADASIAVINFLAALNMSASNDENDMQLGPIVIHCITC